MGSHTEWGQVLFFDYLENVKVKKQDLTPFFPGRWLVDCLKKEYLSASKNRQKWRFSIWSRTLDRPCRFV